MEATTIDFIELISYKSQYKVKLNLQSCSRIIGVLDPSGEGIYYTKRTRKHLFRKTNSLGINHKLLTTDELKYKWIVIDYEGKRLVTSREYFLAHGQLLHFKDKGFEPQVFLPLSEFGVDKVKQFEKESVQQDLFDEVLK